MQNANDTKSTHDQPRHPYNPYTQNQKPCPLKQWHLTSLLSCQFHKDLTQYSPSPTKDVQRQQSSFHAMKISQQKKQPPYTSNTYSLTLDYQLKSSVTETHVLCPNSCKQHVKSQGIKQTLSTAYHPRTDGQSERNNQWLETAITISSLIKNKRTGPLIFQSHNSHITIGQVIQQGSPHSSF